MVILVFFVLHWYLSLFTQTFFHHRYSAHRMFTMSKSWEKFFFFLSFFFQGSSYLSPYAYGILHRLHHDNADTENDPHSPKYDKSILKMMWRTKIIYNNIFSGKARVDEKYTKNLPQWTAFDRFADLWAVRIGWGLLYILFYYYFATAWWMYLLLPIHFVMGPFHGVIINWFAHKYGYVTYPVNDTSKNLMPFDIFMMGEGYHNNHHTHASRANFAIRWFELDPVYPVIRALHFFGIIRLKAATANI